MIKNALKLSGLHKAYPSGFELVDIGFTVPTGKIMGFVGPNGAGKTTTIKSILGTIRPDAGYVSFFDKEPDESTHERLGIVTDATLYEDEWYVLDVEKAVRPFYSQWNQSKFNALLNMFGIDKKSG